MSEQVRVLEGHLDTGHGRSYGVIVSRFNGFITERLLEGALDCFRRHGIGTEAITVVRVPGAFEIPMALVRMAKSGQYAGIVCLGAVIRGSTPHFDYVAAEVSKGVASVAMEQGIPVGFGVLTTDTVEQAIDRAGTKAGNKGWETAQSMIEMADLFTKI
ncbi:MAG: 6,7-dimethyl-8-ribityllumazine synthase [Magnetococcales bacterium]|nr:6,7-dimethyl-8-ribityllumazine synthase [Magnetococcales bacterium]MBF0603699.1 6,7-dimethyl-8-ribityllumazine synthase [Magnetococcales bacterium]HAT48952.1 6,7-dimethyl-8-ribityllumazine synthase [Alphaproteobacteria bacterium]